MKSLTAFGWFGGKTRHLPWLLPLLIGAITRFETQHYVEPFGGSGAILLNLPPCKLETYNDLHGEVVNFFRVLREHPALLTQQLSLTPFSRKEYLLALNPDLRGLSEIERARRFYVRARQVRSGLATVATPGRWAYCQTNSMAGMGQTTHRYLASIPGLLDVAERLRRVQIEQSPATEVIKRFDGQETLFYCDPPYVHGSRIGPADYVHEMSDEQHEILAQTLLNVKGKVLLSGYRSPLYDKLYKGWFRAEVEGTVSMSHARVKRTEVLWMNFDPRVGRKRGRPSKLVELKETA